MRLHEAGKLDDAEQLYRRILAANPRHFESLHLLGVIASQRGHHAEAIQQMDAAIEINPNIAPAFNNRGLALAELGRAEEALQSFDRAISLSPDYAAAHFGRANALTKLRRLDEALASFDTAIALKPDYVSAIFNRGNVLSDLKRTSEALACFDQAIALKSNYPEAFFNRGNLLAELKRLDEAVASFDRAIALKPDFDAALFNRGNLLKELKRFDEALKDLDAYVALRPTSAKGLNNRGLILSELDRPDEALKDYDSAIELDPNYARAFNNRGILLKDLRRFEQALADLDRAIALDPVYAEAFNNRGTVIKELEGREAALADFDKAIELKPDFHEALNNRGITLHELKRIDEALASYDKAVALKPNYAEGLNNRGICRLLAGRYKDGWADYEYRWLIKELRTKRPDIKVPNWQGEDLSGRTLVVYSEQGLGDVIQFSRYLPMLARHNATVTFSVTSKLNRLLRPVTKDVRVVNTRKIGDGFDFQCALMSLPLRFGTDAETVPHRVPYLIAEDELVARWKARIGDGGFKVGIAWQGSPKGKIDKGRSISLAEFYPLSRIPGVRLISLQKHHGLEQLAGLPADVKVELLGEEFDSGPDAFIDTAAVMANLDLIITSDTSIAHLAGASGRPTWVALKFVPDWRWLLDRDDSPWYPTVRLFRQMTDGDWKPVFSRVELELKRLVAARADPNAARVLFKRGNALLRQNKVGEALESFDRAVALEPGHADAWFNRALALKDLHRLQEALQSLARATALNPDHAEALSTQGIVLTELGRPEEALASFDRVVRLKGRDAAVLNNRGIVLMKLKRFDEALAAFDEAVALSEDYAQAFNNRGIVLTEMKRLEEALSSFERAATLDPQAAEICFNRANALAEFDRHEEALAGFDRAIALKPQYPEALFSRGTALLQLKRPEEALASFDRAIGIRPNYAAAFNNRGNALKDLGRLGEALVSFDKAILLNPASAEFFLNRGMVLRQLKRLDEALASHDKAVALKPDSAEAIDCRSTTLKEMGRLDEALRELDRAIALNPEFAGGRFNRGVVKLLAGRYDEGWRDYEWRWKTKDFLGKRPKINAREWQGEDIAGQSIAVYGEQGLGDIIQFARYLPLLAKRGAEVSFFTDVRMHRLLSSLDGRIDLHGTRGTSKAVDTCCALLSLPNRFRTTLSTIPAEVPYLRAEKESVARWKERLSDHGFRVGIAWQGNPRGDVDVGRSVALSEFWPLARIPGVRLISLQKHNGLEQLVTLPAGMAVEQLGEDFDSGPDAFIDTAAVMENLDLIITSDTSIAHLAGALGRPTWLALKKIPDWRWLLEREDSPWYPSMRLFRQQVDGDWPSVFSRIADELSRLLVRPAVHSQRAETQSESAAHSADVTRIFEDAVASYKAGSYDAAEACCRDVLKVQLYHFGSLYLLGVIAGKRGHHAEAVRQIDAALKIDPSVAEAHHHLGTALIELGRYDEAVASFDRAIALNGQFAQALNSRGIALQHLKRFDEALLSFEKAIELKPDFAAAHNNLGILLKEKKRLNEALAAYDRAIALKPDFTDARTNRGTCKLLAGRYDEGWADYDWRLKRSDLSRKGLAGAVPEWRGEALSRRHIAVYGEQGFGDIIQFARYLPMLVQHGAKVTFFVDEALHHLLKQLDSGIQLTNTEPTGAFDLQSALMSLPRGFGTALDFVPNQVPYLHADKDRVAWWKARLGDHGFKVGIAWQGNPRRPIDRGRSVPLTMFLPLACLPGVRLISLQKHDGLDQLVHLSADKRPELLGEDFDSGKDAFIDTAAVMESLDLVITADTSIAHLAGALGRPTWVALKHVPDWRWLLDREDSPWYPTMRLFRQERDGDWSGVFTRIGDALQSKLRSSTVEPLSSPASAVDVQRLFKEAVAVYRSGRLDRAETICRRLLESDPSHARNLHLLGVIAGQRGNKEEAIRHISAALKVNPGLSEAHNNLGIALMDLNRLSDALASFDRAIGLRSNYAEALYNRGDVLAALKRPDEALASYDRAIEAKPDYAEAFNNRGNVLAEMGRTDDALASFGKAIALKPDFATAFNNRGNVLRELDRLDDALTSYEKAITLQPDEAESHKNRGAVLKELKRLDEALESFDRAIFLKPDLADAWRTRGMCRLLAGRFNDGWSDYEWRQEITDGKSPTIAARPWKGEDIAGRSIAITCEQGMGDVIQFVRYLPLLVERGANVTFFADAKLHRLLSTLHLPIRIRNAVAAGEVFDFKCSLMSLPLRFGTDGKTIPNRVPYLEAEDDLVARWKARIGHSGFKIGIAWQGNPKGKIDLGRSIPVHEFVPLARLSGVRLISLQKHHGLDQLDALPPEIHIEQLRADFDSGSDAFIDTAAVMKSLDLIITSDTVIAHLAGALGRPAWVVLKYVPDWRWMLDREDSPWYPTLRLFRQSRRGDWKPPFSQIEQELVSMLPDSGKVSPTPAPPRNPTPHATVQVSWGELVDKITILQIKQQRLKSSEAISNVRRELTALEEAELDIRSIAGIPRLKDELRSVNEALWDIEDQIRAQEAVQTFGDEFIRLARAVYFHNDKRGSLKRRINEVTNSTLIEEKQYTAYPDQPARQHNSLSEPSAETRDNGRALLENMNVRIKRCRHGVMMYFRNDMYIGRSLDLYGEFSEGEIALFKQLVQPGMTVVDVGANIGAHTIYFANAVGMGGRVFAFEPQRVIYQMLCGNVALNLHTNVAAIHGALGSSAGALVLPKIDYSSGGNFGGVSLKTTDEGERISVKSLDSYDLEACHFIKVDVEGMEREVLKGAVLTIERHQPLLYVENDRLDDSENLIKWLMEKNYRVYWHTPPLFNPSNFLEQHENVFVRTISVNMICIPATKTIKVHGLREITSPQDTLPAQHRAHRRPLSPLP